MREDVRVRRRVWEEEFVCLSWEVGGGGRKVRAGGGAGF